MISTSRLAQFCAMLICFFFLGLPSEGAVIFEDNFDSQPEWSKSAVPGASNECDYLPCTGAPNNWSTWRAAPWATPVSPPISITSSIAPDHTSGSGKAFFVQVQNVASDPNFASDAIIAKKFSQDYQELYLRFWLRTQAGWKWSPEINNAHKIIHLFHYDGVGNFYQNGTSGSESPLTFFDLATGWGTGPSMYYMTYRCSPVGSYYCTGGPDNDVLKLLNSGPSTAVGNWADGQWHQYDLHFKMNSIGLANGIAEFTYDGKLIVSQNTIKWALSGTPAGTGWNSLSIGGNSDTKWSGGPAEQWYAIDDLIVSTTPIGTDSVPVDNVLPSVVITSPVNTASVSDVITVSANASDNVGLSKVEFYVNSALDKTITVPPFSYSFDTKTKANGTYTLNARAYDVAGNVGQSANISFVVNNSSAQDTTAPVVNSFTMPSVSSSLSVPITAFTASDAVGVIGYKITESAISPLSSAAGWSATPPSTFIFSASGARIAYAWAKDAAGNVSISRSASVTISVSTDSSILGFNSIGTTIDYGDSNYVNVTRFMMGSQAGNAVSMSAYIANPVSPSPNNQFQLAIYSDINGVPGSLITASITQAITPNAWNTVPVSASLSANTAYWLGYNTNGLGISANNITYSAGTDQQTYYMEKAFGNFPAVFVANSSFTNPFKNSIYVTFTTTPSTPILTFPDTIPPVVNTFTMPATSSSLIVPITQFLASDAVGVTGYMITESAAPPAAGVAGWSATAPTSFTFSGAGVRTDYAWAKDAAGNISASRSATVTITVPDTIAPSVSLTAPVSGAVVRGTKVVAASASDNIGVIKVEFYVDDALSFTDTVSPYTFNWNTATVSRSSHRLRAKAYDAAGNAGSSLEVIVRVKR